MEVKPQIQVFKDYFVVPIQVLKYPGDIDMMSFYNLTEPCLRVWSY